MSSSQDNVGRIKAAASSLLKGGTLTNEPCPKCSGVQVRLSDKTMCVNCGNASNTIGTQPKAEPDEAARAVRLSPDLASAASLIGEKIILLASEIRRENDISIQIQKATLLETYLRILEKTKALRT
jgi:uncharacterized Zn finger protein (UPF0148 family)